MPVALAEAEAAPEPVAEADLVPEAVEEAEPEAEEAADRMLALRSRIHICLHAQHTHRDAGTSALACALEPAGRSVGVGAAVLGDAASHVLVLADGLHVRRVRAGAMYPLAHVCAHLVCLLGAPNGSEHACWRVGSNSDARGNGEEGEDGG